MEDRKLPGTPFDRFAVTPLTEDSGLVEWVHRLAALRVAVQESLIAEGLWTHKHTNPAIKKMYDEFQARLLNLLRPEPVHRCNGQQTRLWIAVWSASAQSTLH